MKKLSLLTAFLFLSVMLMAQYPTKQTMGSSGTIVVSKGGLASDSGFVNASYPDTLSASLSRIAKYPGAQIRVGDNIWLRNAAATSWSIIGSSSGGLDSISIDSLRQKVDSVVFRSSEVADTVLYYINGQSTVAGLIDHQNGLISGGIVTWKRYGLVFDITPGIYRISGRRFQSAADTTKLDAADVSYARIDVIALDTAGHIVVIKGVPSANPLTPQINPATQVYLTSILVGQNATIPFVTTEVVYDENTEWVGSTTMPYGIDFNSTAYPYHGSKATKGIANSTSGNTFDISFKRPSGNVSIGNFNTLKLFLKVPVNSTPKYVGISFLLNNSTVSSTVYLNPTYGFDVTTGTYSNVSVPLSDFTFYGNTYNSISITYAGLLFDNVYIDYIQLQGGIQNGSNSNSLTDIFKKPGTDSIYYVKNNTPYFGFKDSASSQPLLTNKSVPFAGADGRLTQNNLGLFWDGTNLVAGNNGYYNNSGIYVNGGRGQVTASGTGMVIKTNGTEPVDISKKIDFYNNSKRYMTLSVQADSSALIDANLHVVPAIADSFSLGRLTKQWNHLYTKDLYLNGVLFTGGGGGGGATTVYLDWGLASVNDSTLKADSVAFKVIFYNKNSIDSALALKADLLHTHDASDITSGVLASSLLPIASASTLGAFKVGANLSIDGAGVLSATGGGGGGITQMQLDDSTAAIRGDFPTREKVVLQTHSAGASVTISDATTWLIVNPATTLSALAVTMSANPLDGEKKTISFGGQISAGKVVSSLYIYPNFGQSLVATTHGPDTAFAGETIVYTYNLANNKWYKRSGVTSVSLTMPGTLFDASVVGSPITTSGTFLPALKSQSPYTVFGNNTGSSGLPTFSKLNLLTLNTTGTPSVNSFLRGDGSWTLGNLSPWQYNSADIYFNTGNVGINTSTPAAKLTIQDNTITNTVADSSKGIYLVNNTPATSGQAKFSPSIYWQGQGYNTTTSQSNRHLWRMQYQPYSTNQSSGAMNFDYSVNNGLTYQNLGSWGSTGLTATGPLTASGTLLSSNSLTFSGQVPTISAALGNQTNHYTWGTESYSGFTSGSLNKFFKLGGTINPLSGYTSTMVHFAVEPIQAWQGTLGAGSYEAVRINVTENAIPTGQNYLLRAGIGGTSFSSRFDITNTGQVLVGSSGTPKASRIFDVSSTSQASCPFPVMTAAQKTAIGSPNVGDHIYQTDGTEGVYVYKSSGGWVFAY